MRRARRRRWFTAVAAVAVLAVLALLGSCSNGEEDTIGASPDRDALVAAAGLSPCPAGAGGGAELPDLTLPCLGAGPAVSLGALTGKPTLVNIWASWCGPCQKEVPALQATYAAAGKRLRILGVDMEDQDNSALDFARHVGMRYPSVIDRDGALLRHLGFPGPPATVFLDVRGRVVHRVNGPFRDAADLRAQVDRYLQVSL